MGKQDRPSVANPFVKIDRALCGFSGEIRSGVIDARNSRGLGCSLGAHFSLLMKSIRSKFQVSPAAPSGERRMKTKPTRSAGWVGRNLGCSLTTRRRTHATTRSAGVEGAKHVVRIEARTRSVNRGWPSRAATRGVFLHHKSGWRHLSGCGDVLAEVRLSLAAETAHESTVTASGNVAVGCFFFSSARRKFSGGLPRWP